MKRGLLGRFSISFMASLISAAGSSVCARVLRNWKASLSSWNPADSVMETAFWSFSSSVAMVMCGCFLPLCYSIICAELIVNLLFLSVRICTPLPPTPFTI